MAYKHYRIGDFAKALGVTSDFLKHYEQAGLLQVEHREGGYRFYPFNQSGRIIEYLRLRNYGVTVKDMQGVLTTDAASAMAMLDAKAEELQRGIERMQAIVRAHEALRTWFAARKAKPIDWEIREVEPHVFLPHTDTQAFRTDARMTALIKEWCAWMPVTKSAMAVDLASSVPEERLHWGFALPESALRRHRLPVNDVLQTCSFGKALVFHFIGLQGVFKMSAVLDGRHPAFELVRELGFRVAGRSLLINEMRLTDEEGCVDVGVGRFIIPVVR